MATEASVTDQAADEHVEMKVGDDIKHVDEESVSQPKDLERKCDEEMEDLTNVEASVTEDEIRPEVDTLVEDLKKEEVQEGDVIEKESEPEAVEKPVENMEESSVQKLEYEATLETATKELKTKELPDLSAAPSSASEIPDLSTAVEPASDIAGDPDASGSAEILQDGKTSAEDVEHVEETKVGDDIKRVIEESVSQPKDLEGKYNEEKLKVEDSANLEALMITEHEPESEAADEVIEKEPESDGLLEPTDEVIEKEPESKAKEKPSENMEASSEQESEYEAAKEPVVLETTTEEVKTEELPDLSTAPISALETEEKATEPVIQSTAVEPASDVAVDPASAEIPQDEKTPDVEVELSPKSSNKTFDAIAVDPAQVSELNGAGPDVTEKTKANPDPEIGGGEKELLESVEVEEKDVEEGLTLSEKVVTATAVAEVPSEGGGFEKVEEKEGGSLDTATEVDKTSLVETSNDLDAATEGLEGETSRDLDVDSTAAEKLVNKDSEDKDESGEADDAEDGTGTKTEGEAPKDPDATTDVAEVSTDKLVNEDSEDKKDEVDDAKDGTGMKTEGEAAENQVTVKTSQRQSNSIMSKVKQSIVKVKKAIIGKSKSSKTMSSESKDDPKS